MAKKKVVADLRHWQVAVKLNDIIDGKQENINNFRISSFYQPPSWNRLLLLSMEVDERQNLQRLHYAIIFNDKLIKRGVVLPDDVELTENRQMHRTDWLKKVFFPESYKAGTVVVGWNLPYIISRLACAVSPSKKDSTYFSFSLVESENYPNIKVKSITAQSAFIEFVRSTGIWKHHPGHFLDLHTLSHALSNKDNGYADTLKNWNVTTNDDVLKDTYSLFKTLKNEYDLHPIAKEATKIYSAAGIGKAYLAAMGLKNNAGTLDDEIQGYAMAAYHAGRVEVRRRKEIVPVVYTDVTSMYPTVFSLQRLWDWVIAKELEAYEDTDAVIEMLTGVNIEGLYRKDAFVNIPGLCLVVPDGDILPIKTTWNEDEHIPDDDIKMSVTYVSSKNPMWFTLADVIASKILTGKVPKILKAIRVRPVGVQEGLKPIKIRGEVVVDPYKDNLFKVLIEQRRVARDTGNDMLQSALKIIANSTGYGIFAEFQPESLKTKDKQVEINHFGITEWKTKGKTYDVPRQWTNPIIGTVITGAARLILAMIEKSVTDKGLTYAFCDTDSMAIIADSSSWNVVKDIVDGFKSLNPYNFDGSILKIEDENHVDGEMNPLYCYAISSKRYALFNLDDDNGVKLRKVSAHGLGHLLPVADKWIDQLWTNNIKAELGLKHSKPEWLNRPQLARYELTQVRMWRKYQHLPYSKQMKPFDKGIMAWPMMSSEVKRLYASWSTNLDEWRDWTWVDDNGKDVTLANDDDTDPLFVHLKSMGRLIRTHMQNPESKFEDAGGKPCGFKTIGPLYRRSVEVINFQYHGKEQMADNMTEVLLKKKKEITIDWDWLRNELSKYNQVDVAKLYGANQSAVSKALGRDKPRKATVKKMHKILIELEKATQ